MNDKFFKETEQVLAAVREGIIGNISLSSAQNKYLKNLLLFALINASSNSTVIRKNFIPLVNKLYKGYLIKILKDFLGDDDDGDLDSALEVNLNKIMLNSKLSKNKKITLAFTPKNIFSFLKTSTNGHSQKDYIKQLIAYKEAMNTNQHNLP